jgi:hypothetical protein
LCGQVGPGIFGNLDSAVVCVAAPVANSLMLHVVMLQHLFLDYLRETLIQIL